MESITHFSHEHPLINSQLEAGKHDNDAYGCEVCTSLFLHKSCAQLPMEIVHKSHEHHSLFLLSKPPSRYSEFDICDLCNNSLLHSFFYHCYFDDCNLHIKCAFKEKESIVSSNNDLTLNHPSHKHHPLTIQPRPSSFLCDTCDVKDEDLSYQCTSCQYWIHRRCPMLPSTTKHDVHSHTLSLSIGLPSQYHNFFYFCGICEHHLDITAGLASLLSLVQILCSYQMHGNTEIPNRS
ncbi:hypothetical protein LIER_00866 [Lithospermum erythrorhizon]|uniref:DC1 domain-containing protein n=1 Tax=Lithospermum erythrorhizon TaxID=34254 RepID=A0AAV3NIX6_LITER